MRECFGWTALAMVLMAGCGGKVSSSSENTDGPNLPRVAVWRLPVDTPLISIGSSDDPDYDLERGGNGALFPDGRLVVSVGGDWPVRVYGTDGKLVKKFRKGSGPEEWSVIDNNMSVRRVTGDSIAIGDFMNGPVKMLSSALTVGRTIPHFRVPGGMMFPCELLPDGRWLGIRDESNREVQPGNRRSPMYWVRAAADMTSDTLLHTFPGTFYLQPRPRTFMPPIFGAITVYACQGARLYVTTNEVPEIEVWDTLGALVRKIPLNLPADPVTEADKTAYVANRLKLLRDWGVGEKNVAFEAEALKTATFASTFAYVGRLYPSDDGSLWVERVDRGHDAAAELLVFSAEGKLVATTTLQSGHRINHIGRDAITVLHQDDKGRSVVSVVPIRR